MATKLEETTTTARRVLVGCGVLVIAILLYNFASGLLKPEAPEFNPYPTKADESFGTLPKLSFTSLSLPENTNPNYRIYTTDGLLPKIYQYINVYKTKTPRQSLTAQDKAEQTAKKLGFTVKPQTISSTELKWVEDQRVLKINKLFGTVTLTTNFKKHKNASAKRKISAEYNTHVNQARSLLKRVGLFPSKYEKNSEALLTYIRLSTTYDIRKASAASEANMVRVDFFKKEESLTPVIPETFSDDQKEEIRKLAIYSDVLASDPFKGFIYIISNGSTSPKGIYQLRYTDWELEDKSRYKIMSIDDAWKKVQNNEGFLQYLSKQETDPFKPYVPLNVNEFLLTDVEIIYFSSNEYIQYLQPVYKFSGIASLADDEELADFIIYYPAVK